MELSFQFSSVAELMWMEGHGPYVWAAYAITIVGICALGLKVRRMRKNFFRIQASIARRQGPSQSEHTS